jgi:sugar transferase EpsL
MKRMFDITISMALIVLFTPLYIIISFLTYMNLGTPIFFFQNRPGFEGKIFKLIKFRTMVNEVNETGSLIDDEKRITPFGHFLRSSSLDELPELLNVIIGDMSLVGPRPLLEEYLDLYDDFELRRHEVKPGITGWAQINGRNHLSWRQKFELDIWYVDNHSILLDIKILVLTILKVLKREGITEEGKVSAQKFKGHQSE